MSRLAVLLSFILKWDEDSNLFETVFLVIVLIFINLFNFLLCESGARMTSQLETFDEKFSQCDWYLLPIELKQMYTIFLSDTQNSIKLTSYAGITCERNTSKKVSISIL